jgi:hypothetical protein
MNKRLPLLALATTLIVLSAASTGCGSQPSGPGTLEIVLTYAKDPSKPLTAPANYGLPAPDRLVTIRAIERRAGGGQPLYIAGDPLFRIPSDSEGRVQVELPPDRYLIEILGGEGQAVAKQFPALKPGQHLQLRFNLPPP